MLACGFLRTSTATIRSWFTVKNKFLSLSLNHLCQETQARESQAPVYCHWPSIVAAARPRSFNSSLQLGTSIYSHRKLGSKNVVNVLHKLGFCALYEETWRYELSAVMQQNDKIFDKSFCQFAFDNAHFNAATVDGLNTMHVIGDIRCVIPAISVSPRERYQKLKVACRLRKPLLNVINWW